MENMSDIEGERQRIRQQLNTAYYQKDKEEVIQAARKLNEFAERIIKTKY